VADRYPLGTEINGTITNITDFGIFVELEEGIEGLVHVSEISKEKIKTPVGQYEVGDTLSTKVMNINTEDRRIGLSIKRLGEEDDQSMLEEYVNKSQPAPSSFGAILKENLQEKLNGQAKLAEAEKKAAVQAADENEDAGEAAAGAETDPDGGESAEEA
jgi:small subunit ribosomal protein S1